MKCRIATTKDAAAIRAIYAPYVEGTPITFEYDVPSVLEFEQRILNTLSRYPYYVAEEAGVITGYAYASVFKGRTAYDWSVEISIYVDKDKRQNGIGQLLYHTLETALKRQNICNICACITYPNEQSIAFHSRQGFREVAHFTKSGYKLGAWHDMIWMEKTLLPHPVPPAPFIPFPQLPVAE